MAPHHGGGHCHVHVPVHHHHHHNHHPVRPVIPVTPVRLVQSRPPVPITPVASVNHHHCPPQNAGPPVIYPIFLPLVACSWHRESQNRRDRHVLKRKAYNDVEQAFIEKAKKNAVVIKLTLQKDKKRFGFSIADSYKPGDLFISKIKKNSPAANEGLCVMETESWRSTALVLKALTRL
ncbi:hypothetical protein L596_026320 [Steinernema carpocapsae]|uniref:PDZ domain-containing protein n=1 Tax=Steinernema carpocapsae TaxID=34508 RepID=A0A4U5M103_STECR|nr:hypothetical protein L596_026320 [Steinernema carpocapsae]